MKTKKTATLSCLLDTKTFVNLSKRANEQGYSVGRYVPDFLVSLFSEEGNINPVFGGLNKPSSSSNLFATKG